MEANLSDILSFKSLFKPDNRTTAATGSAARENTGFVFEDEPVSISQQAQVAYSQSLSRESVIEIQTKDGDNVRIQLQQSSNYLSNQEYNYQQNSNGKQLSYSTLEIGQSSSSFQIQIEGKLDKDEKDAIEDLIKDIGKITHQLYQGNTETAFKLATQLEFDKEELQSYAFDSTQTTTNTYTAAYQEVARLQPDRDSIASVLNQQIENDLFDSFKEHLDDSIDSIKDFMDIDDRSSLLNNVSDFFERSLKPISHPGFDITALLDIDD